MLRNTKTKNQMTPELTEEERWEFKKLRIKEPNNPWVDIIEQGYALAKKIIVNHKIKTNDSK